MTVLGATCVYAVLTVSGMRPDDRALFVAADAALVIVIAEILRERT